MVSQLEDMDVEDGLHMINTHQESSQLLSLVENIRQVEQFEPEALLEVLEQANQVVPKSYDPQVLHADSDALAIVSEQSLSISRKLQSGTAEFSSEHFLGKLFGKVGIDSDSTLAENAYKKIGQFVLDNTSQVKLVFSPENMIGSFVESRAEEPAPERRQPKPRDVIAKERVVRQTSKHAEKRESTTEEVEHISKILQALFEANNGVPVNYLEFICDPKSYSRTVENMFHVSFLVKDGYASIHKVGDTIVISPLDEGHIVGLERRNQAIGSLCFQGWQKMANMLKITHAAITPRCVEEESDG